MSVVLRNPHSVLAALQARPRDVLEVCAPARSPGDAWEHVLDLAGSQRIQVRRRSDRSGGGRRSKADAAKQSGRTTAAEATVKKHPGVDLDTLFHDAGARSDGKGLWLALDHLQDPQNLGAVFRSAAFFGVAGIVLTRERSAPLSSTVYDVACGGVEVVPFSVLPNLSRAVELAKKSGLWVLGTSEHAETDVSRIERDRPWLLVLGNEEQGLRRLTQEKCDMICRLSPQGPVTSLNVSAAASVLIAKLTGAV